MKGLSVLVIALCGACVIWGQTVNYCARSLCRQGRRNIACNNNGSFGRRCPANRTLVNLVPFRRRIVAAHNTRRNTVAGGNLSYFRPAVRMATMQWDAELAKMACFNVKRCIYGRDQCHNVDRFHYSGQNLAMTSWTTSPPISDEAVVMQQIQNWYAENANTTMAEINRFHYPSNGATINHFTLMVSARNTRVGCCAVKFVINGRTYFLLACNYAYANIFNRPVYVAGPRPGTQCHTGMNPNYSNLCSIRERFPVNSV